MKLVVVLVALIAGACSPSRTEGKNRPDLPAPGTAGDGSNNRDDTAAQNDAAQAGAGSAARAATNDGGQPGPAKGGGGTNALGTGGSGNGTGGVGGDVAGARGSGGMSGDSTGTNADAGVLSGGTGGADTRGSGGSGGVAGGSGGIGTGGTSAGTGGVTEPPSCPQPPDQFESPQRNDSLDYATPDTKLPAGDGTNDTLSVSSTFDRADDQDWFTFGTANSVQGAAAHNPVPVHLHWQATDARVVAIRVTCGNKLSACSGATIGPNSSAPVCIPSPTTSTGDLTFTCGASFSVTAAYVQQDSSACSGSIDLSYEPAQ